MLRKEKRIPHVDTTSSQIPVALQTQKRKCFSCIFSCQIYIEKRFCESTFPKTIFFDAPMLPNNYNNNNNLIIPFSPIDQCEIQMNDLFLLLKHKPDEIKVRWGMCCVWFHELCVVWVHWGAGPTSSLSGVQWTQWAGGWGELCSTHS